MNRTLSYLACLLLTSSAIAPAIAADDDNLLPVEQAFQVQAKATTHSTIQLDFKVANDYYLYRERIKISSADTGVTMAALDLPAGEKKHDEFLGDVEVYHHAFSAVQHLTVPADAAGVSVSVRFQGCHQVDPKICFPPRTVKLDVALPAAAATTPAAGNSLAQSLSTSAVSSPLLGNAQPLPAEQAFIFEAIATNGDEVMARFTMPKGYYLYRDQSHFSTAVDSGITLGAIRWPEGVSHKDVNFGATTVYFNQVEVPIALKRSGDKAQTLKLTSSFQGCLENSVCYPVMTRSVDIALPAGNAMSTAAASPTADAAGNADLSEEQQLAARLSDSRLVALLSFFGFGLLLAFTPCVFPMIPILSGIIAGAGENISTKRAFVLSVVYVLASSVIFTLAGVGAGLAGKSLQAMFQAPWILLSFSGLFVVLSLSMFGFYELQLPSSLQSKIANVSNRQQGGSLLGVAIMGLFSALIVGPCVAPPLAAAVLYIAETHSPVFGGLALFCLSLGMGAPLIVVGTGAGFLLPRAGAWMDPVKAVFGVTFLWMAIWISSRVVGETWIDLAAACLLIGSGVYMGAVDRLPDAASGWSKLWKSLGLIQLILGAAMLASIGAGMAGHGPSASGASTQTNQVAFKRIKSEADFDREIAAAGGKPVMLDFYADWCVSCKEMEKFTFSKVEVQQALTGFVSLQADVTANDDADQALMKRFGIIAPPDTLFFGTDGHERRGLRLTGPEDPDKFVHRVEAATK